MFYKIKVSAIENPIKEAATLSLDIPADLKESFKYLPGQHLVFKFTIDGQEVRRSYSINSSPFTGEDLKVTVKRVKNGLVSNYICDQVKKGDELEVMAPQGRFCADINESEYKTYFLFAAGSGITPIISILKSVLSVSEDSFVNLFYGNSNQNAIIFKQELDDLIAQYPQRLRVIHTLSKPKWSAWKKWKGRKGRMDASGVEWFINTNPPTAQNTNYYICGPGAMNSSIKNTLIGLGVPEELIHFEQFGTAPTNNKQDISSFPNAKLTVKQGNETHELRVPQNTSILEALIAQGIDAPFSCQSGICATCTARITKGKIEMKSTMALDEEEIENGMILTCQAIPVTEEVEIEYLD